MVQEPYVNNKKIISNCPQKYDIFPSNKKDNKRTAIFCSRHLKLTEINELCSQKMTTIGGTIGGKNIIFSSIYMHYNEPVISKEMTDLINYCRKNAYQLIIGADTNSHSSLWGPSPKTRCKRGETLEQWILQEGLIVRNQVEIPTFSNKRCSSNIDVTLSLNLSLPLHDWTVDTDYNL